MVCRTTRIGSAITSYARLAAGLEDEQTLSTFHDLVREGRQAASPTRAQVTTFIDEQTIAVSQDGSLTDARRRSIINRLGQAREQGMDGRTFYAATRLMERTRSARAALDAYSDGLARDLGVSRAQVDTDLRAGIDEAEAGGRGRTAPGDWRQEFGTRTENAHLPLDRQTAYAIHQLEQRRAAARAAAPTRRAVTRTPVVSRAVRAVGYNPETGRLEVEMNSRPGHGYAYRVPQHVYDEMMSGSIGSYFATQIRNNPAYQYRTADEHEAAAALTQCSTCGQFAGAGHTCPTRDSQEERNRTERLARESARASRVNTPASPLADALFNTRVETLMDNTGMTRGDAQAAIEAEDLLASRRAAAIATPAAPVAQAPREPRRLGYVADRRYHGTSSSFRCANLSTVQSEARQGTPVSLEVHAIVTQVATDGGARYSWGGNVSGRVNVEYLGRGQGFRVTGVTEPGDSGRDQLRCTCTEYRRNYDCEHVRQTVADMNARINQDRLRDQHSIGQATATVAGDLAQDRAESVAAQETSQTTWGEPEVSYTEDMRAFQADYRAAKQRLDNGETVVPYMRENATDGLGARGTGRSFGLELEFDIEPGVDRREAIRAIGRDLYNAGLTSSASQVGYASARRRGYTEEHRQGWSFESDPTVAGEIVSPIMYDTPETWANLEKVCEIVRRHGGRASVNAGSHIHVGAGNYDHTVNNYNRLLGTFREHEDLIYRMSTNPERGTHRGPGYCRPNTISATGYSSVSDATRQNYGHNIGLNLQSMHGRSSDHAEFRTWDSSIDPSIIQAQIKMSLGITEAAFRDTDRTPTGHTPLGSHRAHNRAEHGATRRLTGDAWKEDTKSFRQFADQNFRRRADKAQMTALFAITKWQRGR